MSATDQGAASERTAPAQPERGPSPQLDCLLALGNLERLWAYYSQSDGALFEERCREAARELAETVWVLASIDSSILDCAGSGSRAYLEETVRLLERWATTVDRYPDGENFRSGMRIFHVGSEIKRWLARALGGSPYAKGEWSSQQLDFAASWVRWRGHLPRKALLAGRPDELVSRLGATSTISVVGDIRRSQELMTYATDSADFSRRLVEWIKTIRSLTDEHAGLFDKFTGDGFLVHFNAALCPIDQRDAKNAFLAFCRDVMAFSQPFFRDWARSIKKIPREPIGLALGADMGRVEFHDEENHLIAVGDTVVWASRMAAEARAGELVVNNLLGVSLEAAPCVTLGERSGVTKSGEDFTGMLLQFEDSAPA